MSRPDKGEASTWVPPPPTSNFSSNAFRLSLILSCGTEEITIQRTHSELQIDSLYEEVLLESPDSLPSPSVSSQCSHTLVWFVAAGNRRQFRLLFVVLHVPFSGDAELGDFSMKAIGRVASYIVSWRCLG